MKKVLVVSGIIIGAILMLFATWQINKFNQQEILDGTGIIVTKNWSDDLQAAVDRYGECSEGWEDRIIPRPYLPIKIYCNRPVMPDNFGDIALLYKTNILNNLSLINKDYWDQPEFFPNFKEQVVPVLAAYDSSRWGVTIPEVYPSATVFEHAQKGTTILGETLVRSGPLGERYTLLDLDIVFPETFVWARDESMSIITNPTSVKDYFEVSVTPDRMLFEPSFPVWPKNWTQMVHFTVKISEDTPTGKYAVGLWFSPIKDSTITQQMFLKYGTLYESNLLVNPSTPWYIMYIQVD
jgi:hypothetical protein